MVGRTTVVVAHRLSTIKNADMIAVVRNGVILETGKLSTRLLEISRFYYQFGIESCPYVYVIWHRALWKLPPANDNLVLVTGISRNNEVVRCSSDNRSRAQLTIHSRPAAASFACQAHTRSSSRIQMADTLSSSASKPCIRVKQSRMSYVQCRLETRLRT